MCRVAAFCKPRVVVGLLRSETDGTQRSMTLSFKGAAMLIWHDADEPYERGMVESAQDAPLFDTSSGNSRWVRQYLEWCQPECVHRAEEVQGLSSVI